MVYDFSDLPTELTEEQIKEIAKKEHEQDANLKYESYEAFTDEDVIEYTLNDLSKRVTHDTITKFLNLCVYLSAYTDEPINMFGKGVSSIGKTHNAVETSKYFPEFDVHLYADLTPKALYHMDGKILDGSGREVMPEDYPKEPKKKDFDDAETGKFEKAEKDYEEKLINFNIRM